MLFRMAVDKDSAVCTRWVCILSKVVCVSLLMPLLEIPSTVLGANNARESFQELIRAGHGGPVSTCPIDPMDPPSLMNLVRAASSVHIIDEHLIDRPRSRAPFASTPSGTNV